MASGAEILVITGLIRKLRQLAQSSSLLRTLESPQSRTMYSSLTSLRGFGAQSIPSDHPISSDSRASLQPSGNTRHAPRSQPPSRLSRGFYDTHGNLHRNSNQNHSFLATSAGRTSSHRNLATSAIDVAKAQLGADKVQPGRIVEFKQRPGFYSLGLVVQQKMQFWEVEDITGTLQTVPEKDILYVLPGGNTFTTAQLHIISQEARNKEDECIQEAMMSLAWEISEPAALYTVPEMAQLLFGSTTPAECSAAYRLLFADRLYFKQVGRTPPMYAARASSEMESIKASVEQKREEHARLTQFLADVQAVRSLPRKHRPTQSQWEQGSHMERITWLIACALGKANPSGEPGRLKTLDTLTAAGCDRTPQGAVALLQDMGYWPPHVHLNLLVNDMTERFPEELESTAAEKLQYPPEDPDAHLRSDLTHLDVFTIDDANTTEIDDGVSAEKLPGGGIRVWIHVADPSRYVTLGEGLDEEARRRSKTLYLPTGMIPMFPMPLATGVFSLVAGRQCCALTVTCVVDEESGNIVPGSSEVCPSTVVPRFRLTYDDVDNMLPGSSQNTSHSDDNKSSFALQSLSTSTTTTIPTAHDSPQSHALNLLLTAAHARHRFRRSNGAIEISLPETKIYVENITEETPCITITADMPPPPPPPPPTSSSSAAAAPPLLSLSPSSPFQSLSRFLVAEMMILAGEVCARVGASLDIPLPYRGQPDPQLPSKEELERVPEGPCRMTMLRSCMPRSILAADKPIRHAGLGLDGYVQVTSPIRRYGDMLAHWQLKASLRGEKPPLNAVELSAVLNELGTATQQAIKLEREVQSYWIARYFKQMMEKEPERTWTATFLGWFKQEAGLGRVLLDDLGLESLVKTARPAMPGSKLEVKCSSADPLTSSLRLDEVFIATKNENTDNSGDSSSSSTLKLI